MAMDEKGLGQRLQVARVRVGLTQQALCQKAGLSYSTLTKIERGAIKTPSVFTVARIASIVGVSLDELMGQNTSLKTHRTRSKSGIRFVYFDVNGCLVRFFHRAFTRLAEESGAPADVIETTFWHYNDLICRGDMTLEAFNRTLAEQLGMPTVNWLDYYLEAIEAIPAMQELVRWAHEHYAIGLLSNIMPGFIATMRQRRLIPDVDYDAIVDSSEVKHIKPEAEMYKIATGRAHCEAAEILLVDDSRANLIAAEKHGWHVLWFDDYRPDESVARVRDALALPD